MNRMVSDYLICQRWFYQVVVTLPSRDSAFGRQPFSLAVWRLIKILCYPIVECLAPDSICLLMQTPRNSTGGSSD